MYTTLKIIHASCALLSFTGFFIRGILMIKSSPLLKSKLVKVLPHIIDTILLITAVALVVISQQYPTLFNWLSFKIVGLIAYIGLGLVAFRFAKQMPQKIIAWVLALFIFTGIVYLAVNKPF